MKPSQVITASSIRHKIDPKMALDAVAQGLANHTMLSFHKGQSVLVAKLLGQGACEIFLFTVDSPLSLAHAAKFFIQQLRNSDLHVAYINYTTEGLLKLMRMLGENPVPSDRPGFEWMITRI
jgi:hypothetical protein